jgi:branched-chain amino acid transport system ATP-binding protein
VNGAAILRTQGLTKTFGGFVANRNVSVDFPRGKLTAIIGPNGAGKSTFFNMISGGIKPSSGEILFEGKNVVGVKQHHFAEIGISKSFQITNLFPDLTVLENVRVAVQAIRCRFDLWSPRIRHREWSDKAEELLRLVGLQERLRNRADGLAHGEQRSLEIAVTPDEIRSNDEVRRVYLGKAQH